MLLDGKLKLDFNGGEIKVDIITTTVAALVAINASNQVQQEEEQEEQEKQRKYEEGKIRQLLLSGGTENMNLNATETVIAVNIRLKEYYNKTFNSDAKWVAYIDDKEIICDSLTECLQKTISICDAKSIQILPRSVEESVVDGYTVIMKIQKD